MTETSLEKILDSIAEFVDTIPGHDSENCRFWIGESRVERHNPLDRLKHLLRAAWYAGVADGEDK